MGPLAGSYPGPGASASWEAGPVRERLSPPNPGQRLSPSPPGARGSASSSANTRSSTGPRSFCSRSTCTPKCSFAGRPVPRSMGISRPPRAIPTSAQRWKALGRRARRSTCERSPAFLAARVSGLRRPSRPDWWRPFPPSRVGSTDRPWPSGALTSSEAPKGSGARAIRARPSRGGSSRSTARRRGPPFGPCAMAPGAGKCVGSPTRVGSGSWRTAGSPGRPGTPCGPSGPGSPSPTVRPCSTSSARSPPTASGRSGPATARPWPRS